MEPAPQPTCERARTWLSLRLDGELSELEGALLDAHLERCNTCRATAAAIEATTSAIRSAPVELPLRPVAIPRARGRDSLRAFYAAAAATLCFVVVLTGLGSFGAVQVVGNSGPAPHLQRVSAVAGGTSDDLLLLAGIRVLRNERPLPGHIVWPA
jgi:predicted anti-sigma-YlaC factor YlaD